MKLYEIDSALDALIDPETGELSDYEAFVALSLERDQKIENTALYIKNLNAESAALKAEEDRLRDRRKAAENKSKRLSEYLGYALNGEKFETAKCSVGFRRSTALEVSAPTLAAAWLESNGHPDLVVHGDPTLDKRNVTALVKAGVSVPGVELVERQSIQVR